MELGGKNPLIVLDDVDPKKAAADAAYACFSAAGQLCVSMERIYVLKGVADAFIPAFAERVSSLRVGPDFDYTTDVGSLATQAQLERVTAHLDDAVAKGATVLAGGHARPDLGPYFVEPTVLTDVTSEMACSTNETFGPLVAVTVVDDEDAAVAAANASEFGLNASVLGRSRSRARRVAARLQAGSVNVNEGYRASFGSVDAPMGGVKHSGLGRRNGPEGLLRFTEAKTVAESTGLLQLPAHRSRVREEWSGRCCCSCARCGRSTGGSGILRRIAAAGWRDIRLSRWHRCTLAGALAAQAAREGMRLRRISRCPAASDRSGATSPRRRTGRACPCRAGAGAARMPVSAWSRGSEIVEVPAANADRSHHPAR